MKFMNSCANCYENYYKSSSEWIVMACDLPHLVVWVDIIEFEFWPSEKGFKYWPAKVIAVDNKNYGATIDVCFFGHFQFATVKSTDCYLYSTQCPYFNCSEYCDSRDIAGALQVSLFH